MGDDSLMISRCHEHIAAALRQARMKGLDDVSVAVALVSEALIMTLGVEPRRGDAMVKFLLLLAGEVTAQEQFLLLERAGVSETDVANARRDHIERRASNPVHMIPPQAMTVWAKGIADALLAADDG